MIAHVPKNNPIHTVGEQHRTAITAAQASVLDKQFRTAGEFWNTIGEHLKVKLALPTALQEQLPRAVFDKPAKTLANEFASILRNQLPAGAVVDRSIELAHRAQLVLAFHDPDAEIQAVTKRVREVVKDFPREPAHLMRGKNPGDVADPYALAAQLLLCGGTFGRAVETAVAHKAMMIVEGLLGHLHEDVLGAMRGNVRTTEPRKRKGKGSADALDPTTNPF
jgi:hypothetical protein